MMHIPTFPKPETWKHMRMFEKISYFKHYIGQEYVPYLDKLQSKEVAQKMCPYVKCAKVVRILKTPDDICPEDLQKPHLLKAVHGCGWNIPLQNKQASDIPAICKQLKEWNKPYVGNNEPQYKHLTPRFFIEEYVEEIGVGKNPSAAVIFIRCIHGEPVTISIKKGTKQNSYDIQWVPVKPLELPPIPKPATLDIMLQIARDLSKPFECVRIDLYEGVDGYYFSEFTFTPTGGYQFFPMKKELELGKLWK